MSPTSFSRSMVCLLLLAGAWFALTSPVIADDDQANSYRQTLKHHGIQADAASITAMLREIADRTDSKTRVAQLITQLGHADFQKREAAMLALRDMPDFPFQALKKASEHTDPEIAFRASKLLQTAKTSGPSKPLTAAIEYVRLRQMPGMTQPLLNALPHIESRLHAITLQAIHATARDDDRQTLRRALTHEQPLVRRAALAGLASILNDEDKPLIAKLLGDPNDHVKLEAATVMLNGGERKVLSAFGKLLDSGNIDVRAKTAAALRAATGQRFEYVAYDKDDKRQAAVDKWNQWINTNGDTAELKLPITHQRLYLDRIVIALYTGGGVAELDMRGKEINRVNIPDVSGSWSAQRLHNGHLLVTRYGQKLVVELDKNNKEVWRYATGNAYPWNATRLDNGNTLITIGQTATEVDRNGKVVWQHKLNVGSLTDVRRVPNGNTLCLTSQSAIEVDRNGKTVWKVDGLSSAYRVQRLPNGNTLIAERGRSRVIEYDRNKNLVWTFTKVKSPDSAQRLPDGRLLVSGSGGVYLFDNAGNQLWRFPSGQCTAAYQ